MRGTRNRLKAIFIGLAAVALLAVLTACDPMIPVIEPTVPTPTLSGTETPTPRPAPSATPTASPTPDVTPTPTPFPCDEDAGGRHA